MKRSLLFILGILFALNLSAQKDSVIAASNQGRKEYLRETTPAKINIYPVPVRNNSFTIKSDREISFVRITNMIGQDVYREKFNNPDYTLKVVFDNPPIRGIYLVTMQFGDGTRVVRKIMVEGSE
ncbi:MAG: T9SS type A sorting domain-containing protein [Bacteroidales bacterium]|jgi:hypothetical protein|nr:T9SS type A sorting domain-containing protein [Bacteroidales bacterium]